MSQEQEKAGTPAAVHTITILGNKAPQALTIPGRLPGLNEYIAACNSAYGEGNRMKRESMHAVMWQIKAQLRGVRFTKPVFLLFTFYEKDRRRDKDNVSSFARKAIQDALVQCGTLIDDGWGYVTGHLDRFEVDRKTPRIVVEFIEQEVVPACKKRQSRSSKK